MAGQGRLAEQEDKATELVRQADRGVSITDAYNGMSRDEQKAVFSAMKSKGDIEKLGFKDLQFTGIDTDGDGVEDTLGDVYNTRTKTDLYNRSGEADNSPQAVQSRQIDRLFKAVDVDQNGFLSTIELKNGATNNKLSLADRAGLPALATHIGDVQGFFDDDGFDSKGITRNDLKTDAGQKMLNWVNSPDVQKAHAVLETSVTEMVAGGERKPGSGPIDRWYNNLSSKLGNEKIMECYGQAERVLQNLDKAGFKGQWDMHLVGDLSATGTVAMALGGESPGHFRVELVPKTPGDPILVLDPWKNSIEVKDPATYKPSENFLPWTNQNGDVIYGNSEERFRLQERPRLLTEWIAAGKPDGKFNEWLTKNHADLAAKLDPNNRGKLPRDYGFSDYWNQKFQ